MQEFKAPIQKYNFIVSLLFIMALYLPVIYFSSVNMDDIGLVQRLHENHLKINFFNLFFHTSTTKYYRPLLEIIYYLDYAMWGISGNGYHFGNFVFHIANAGLVYLISLQLFKPGEDSSLYATVTMLFFALNPLTCESVAWISGRSDLAGTFFSLLAVNFYFLKNPFRFVLTPLSIFLGLLCKENALAVLPILVLLECFLNCKNKKKVKDNIRGCFIWGIIVFIPLAAYLYLRTNGWEHYTYKYVEAVTPSGGENLVSRKIDILKVLYVFPVIAFYFKKLILPFPLNFAISQINTFFYSVFFLFLFFLNIIWWFKKKISYVFLSLSLFFSFFPALPVALGGVAWVPLAERYLYLSVSIFSMAMVFLIKRFYENGVFSRKVFFCICGGLLLIFSVSTLNREFVWKDSESLWADTLKKNPESSMVLFKYGQTVGGEEAQLAYRKALSISDDFKWKALTLKEIAKYERSIGNYDAAIETLEKVLGLKGTFENYCEAAEIILGMETKDTQKRKDHIGKAIDYYKLAYTKKQTAFVLYKTGILLKKIDKADEANELLIKVVKYYPDSMYAIHAKKQVDKTNKTPDPLPEAMKSQSE